MVHSFKERYRALNQQQKKAVDAIEGPVLVIAGPGTGKTELLTLRVSNILLQTDTSSENILCLTFTNKAAHNMRERLITMIGDEAKHVSIKTFHSFAAEIMDTHPDYFWNGARLATAPQAVVLDTIQSIAKNLPLNNPLAMKFAGNFTQITAIQDALKLAKEAGLTPAKLNALVEANLAFIDTIEQPLTDLLSTPLRYKQLAELQGSIKQLPVQAIDDTIAPLSSLSTVITESLDAAITQDEGTNKTKHTGAWKQRWVQTVDGKKGMHKERQRNEWWRNIAAFYEQYRQTMHARGYYDYSDMLIEVISQIEHNPHLRSDVQEKYHYILIDEFQDTNAAQMRLAHLVASHHGHNQQPNIMVVGDDDQAIFRFNGAEVNTMLQFQKMYRVNKPIVLTKNYRSSQKIIDCAQKVAEQADERLTKYNPSLTKHLTAATSQHQQSEIAHLQYTTYEHQLHDIAKKIQTLWQKGERSIAVLARGHASLEQIARILNQYDVPIHYERQNNVLEHEAIEQIILIARAIEALNSAQKHDLNAAIARFIIHPMWNIPKPTLWRLAIHNRKYNNWHLSLTGSSDKNLKNIGHWLEELARLSATNTPLPLLLEYIIGLRACGSYTSPLRSYYISSSELNRTYVETLSAIRLLLRLVSDFSFRRFAKLSDFIAFIDTAHHSNTIISDPSPFTSGKDAVELLTTHKAKGLEFNSVFLIDALDANWRPRNSNKKAPANLPLQAYGEDYDDYVRLMFVAISRARYSFVASSYLQDTEGSPLMATPILSFIEPTLIELPQNNQAVIDIIEASIQWPTLEAKKEKLLLKPILELYELSPTALINFLDITKHGPRSFVENNLLRIPSASSSRQAHGIAIHKALEIAQNLINAHNFGLEKIYEAYTQALTDQYLPQQELKRFIEHGHTIIRTLFNEFSYQLKEGSVQEQTLYSDNSRPYSIKGTVDRIDFEQDSLTIVDYKTATPLHSLKTKDKNKVVKAWRYKTQLTFYALLARQSAQYARYKNIHTQVVHVEAPTKKQLLLSYTPTDEEIARLDIIIKNVWSLIQNYKLPDISKYPKDISGIQQFENDILNNNHKH